MDVFAKLYQGSGVNVYDPEFHECFPSGDLNIEPMKTVRRVKGVCSLTIASFIQNSSLNIWNLSDVFFLTNCRFTYCRHCQTPGCGWWTLSTFVRLSWAWTSAAHLLRPTLLACGVRLLTGFWYSRSGTNWRRSTSSPASLNLCRRRRWGSLKVSIIKP